MADYKNNHIIPKCLIKQWNVNERNHGGVWVYKKNKKGYSLFHSDSNFSFASENYFYVPQINGNRISSIETYFSKLENKLAYGLSRLNIEVKEHLFTNEEASSEMLQALISLRHRTKKNINSIKTYLFNNLDIKVQLERGLKMDLNVLALENLMNTMIYDFSTYADFGVEIVVFLNRTGNLILCDEPYLIIENCEYHLVTLSPNYFIGLRKVNKQSTFQYIDSISKYDEMMNTLVAKQAHQWIIGNNQENLRKYISVFVQMEKDADPRILKIEDQDSEIIFFNEFRKLLTTF